MIGHRYDYSQTLRPPSLNFTGVKKCKIWPNLDIRNEARYLNFGIHVEAPLTAYLLGKFDAGRSPTLRIRR